MTKPKPRFWYCFSCNQSLPRWLDRPDGWHSIPSCDVGKAFAMRVPKKKDMT